MQIPLQFNASNFLRKLRFITLVPALLLGSLTRANAELAQKDEVMSIPPQEPFFIEETKHTPFISPQKTTFSNRDSDTIYAFKNSKKRRDLAPTESFVIRKLPQPVKDQ
ncbi:MAG: hypothetical protein KME33_25485 [Aetokthonos hydrillicola CCALA 1050]|nr:hypothetical protein [Aetokthonos hydrillicola CCALA 1050]MBW4588519.1 hypothetical protein [Aetokthonos hydrillicola CCALA 1050]